MALLTVPIILYFRELYIIIQFESAKMPSVKSAKIGIYNTELRKNDDRVGISDASYNKKQHSIIGVLSVQQGIIELMNKSLMKEYKQINIIKKKYQTLAHQLLAIPC